MIKLISKIKEDLSIKNELMILVGFDIVISVALAIGYIAKDVYLSGDHYLVDMMFFVVNLLKNFIRVLVSFVFVYRQLKKEHLYYLGE
jgi:ABC-type siderophore export system fused ATPase/permease subunit